MDSAFRPQDERSAVRRLTSEDVTCHCQAAEWSASLTDISLTGAFVESEKIPPVGEKLLVDFTLPFRKKGIRVRFKLKGIIVRTESTQPENASLHAEGFCMRFEGLSNKEKLCLNNYTGNAILATNQI